MRILTILLFCSLNALIKIKKQSSKFNYLKFLNLIKFKLVVNLDSKTIELLLKTLNKQVTLSKAHVNKQTGYNIYLTKMSFDSYDLDCFSNKIEAVTIDLSFNELQFLSGNLLNNLNKLKVFSVQSNKLNYIHVDFFKRSSSLEKIYLNSNNLKTISNQFQHLSNLKELDLSFNFINFISNDSFSKNKQIQILYLNNNNVTNIDILASLINLKHLRLHSNNISSVNRAFKNLVKIEAINLNNNKIKKIESFDFEDLNFLVFLDLSNNLINKIEINAFKGTCSINYFQFLNNIITYEYQNCKSKIYLENLKNNYILIFFCVVFGLVILGLCVFIVLNKTKSNNHQIRFEKIENSKKLSHRKRFKHKKIKRIIVIKSFSDPLCKKSCIKKCYITKSVSYPLVNRYKYKPIKKSITIKKNKKQKYKIRRVKALTKL